MTASHPAIGLATDKLTHALTGVVGGLIIGAIGIAIPVAIVAYPFEDHSAHQLSTAPAEEPGHPTGPVTLPVYIGHIPADRLASLSAALHLK